jgi:hypothetical protein
MAFLSSLHVPPALFDVIPSVKWNCASLKKHRCSKLYGLQGKVKGAQSTQMSTHRTTRAKAPGHISTVRRASKGTLGTQAIGQGNVRHSKYEAKFGYSSSKYRNND